MVKFCLRIYGIPGKTCQTFNYTANFFLCDTNDSTRFIINTEHQITSTWVVCKGGQMLR